MAADSELSLEPSQPTEREAEGLPPKSYAAVADPDVTTDVAYNETAGHVDGANGDEGTATLTNGHKEDSSESSTKASEEQTKDDTPPSTVETGANGEPTAAEQKTQANGEESHPPNGKKSNGTNGSLENEYEVNGDVLVSSKAPKDYYNALAQSRAEEKQSQKTDQADSTQDKKELTSGKTAGARWSQSPIRWAPLNVPLQRRLQTLAVLVHTLSIPGLVTLFFFWCTIPLLWPILVPYLIYCLMSNAGTDGTLRYRSEWYRSLPWWSLFGSYFPARLHRTQELKPTRKYIFGYHPHGIISHGAFAAFATEALGFSQLFPGITNTLLTLDSNFRTPLYRDHILRLGLASVSRESCENLLSKGGLNGEGMGRAITIVVGGASESLNAQPHTLRLILKRRKGFVKLAIRNGADLVPVLAFGENELYEQIKSKEHPYLYKAQMFVKKLAGFTVPLFHARGVFNYDVGMLPYRRPVNIVFGRVIEVEQNRTPSEAEINTIHERYVQELERLWETGKDTFATDRRSELEIIE